MFMTYANKAYNVSGSFQIIHTCFPGFVLKRNMASFHGKLMTFVSATYC